MHKRCGQARPYTMGQLDRVSGSELSLNQDSAPAQAVPPHLDRETGPSGHALNRESDQVQRLSHRQAGCIIPEYKDEVL